MKKLKHINYALVEGIRPPIYSAMKYWGKKPHNIWAEFIKNYCPKNGIVFDPFAGSAISAFEAVKYDRKAIAFDLNPLTAFIIESLSSKFDEKKFVTAYHNIVNPIYNDEIYKTHYIKEYDGENCTIFNYRWTDGVVSHMAMEKPNGDRFFIKAEESDIEKSSSLKNIEIRNWYPTDAFPPLLNVSHKFIKDIGGNSFEHIWTRRNLYLLSLLFNSIKNLTDYDIRIQLLSGFIQTLHLVSKMVVPRNTKSKRDFSGSWGRADYMIRRRSMEQNPLVIFHRSCLEKQGVLKALLDAKDYLPSKPKIADITNTKRIKKTFSINYGIVDAADVSNYIKPKSVDFIITDPPYAGLVPYLDLSLVWLVWLKHIDSKYEPDLKSEITIKKNKIDRSEYRRRLNNAFKQMHNVLKDNGYLIITFHHQRIQEWNDFVHAVKLAGFKFDKVTHQYNKRSGESNVSNPYGTSGADFYIRCVKHRSVDFSDDKSGLTHFIIQKSIEIISLRNEPTPYEFLVNGLVPELLQAGYMQPKEYQSELIKVLEENEGQQKIFKRIENPMSKAGDFWWFNEPTKYIAYPDLPLNERAEQTVISILRRKISVTFDDVLGELFKTYPNGLTPDPRNIKSVLSKYAYMSSGRWKIQPKTISKITEHTSFLTKLSIIGKKANNNIFIGKREQSEITANGEKLNFYSSIENLETICPQYSRQQINRIEMIDQIWFSKKNKIICIFEVENSTGFTAAIQRASNIETEIPKFMVIPNYREKELLSIKDPLFIETFKNYTWKYICYDEINRLLEFFKPSVSDLNKLGKGL